MVELYILGSEAGPLVAPKIGAMLRIGGKWEMCFEIAFSSETHLAEKPEHTFLFD